MLNPKYLEPILPSCWPNAQHCFPLIAQNWKGEGRFWLQLGKINCIDSEAKLLIQDRLAVANPSPEIYTSLLQFMIHNFFLTIVQYVKLRMKSWIFYTLLHLVKARTMMVTNSCNTHIPTKISPDHNTDTNLNDTVSCQSTSFHCVYKGNVIYLEAKLWHWLLSKSTRIQHGTPGMPKC